jgi:hypothetical protein
MCMAGRPPRGAPERAVRARSRRGGWTAAAPSSPACAQRGPAMPRGGPPILPACPPAAHAPPRPVPCPPAPAVDHALTGGCPALQEVAIQCWAGARPAERRAPGPARRARVPAVASAPGVNVGPPGGAGAALARAAMRAKKRGQAAAPAAKGLVCVEQEIASGGGRELAAATGVRPARARSRAGRRPGGPRGCGACTAPAAADGCRAGAGWVDQREARGWVWSRQVGGLCVRGRWGGALAGGGCGGAGGPRRIPLVQRPGVTGRACQGGGRRGRGAQVRVGAGEAPR